jgi:hypothetical protein
MLDATLQNLVARSELAPGIRALLTQNCNITFYNFEYSVLGEIFVRESHKEENKGGIYRAS